MCASCAAPWSPSINRCAAWRAASQESLRAMAISPRDRESGGRVAQTASSMSQLADAVRSSAGHARGASTEISQARDVAERAGQADATWSREWPTFRRVHAASPRSSVSSTSCVPDQHPRSTAVGARRPSGRAFCGGGLRCARCAAHAAREVKALIVDSSARSMPLQLGRRCRSHDAPDELLQRVLVPKPNLSVALEKQWTEQLTFVCESIQCVDHK